MVAMIDILHQADGIFSANFNGAVRLGLAGLGVCIGRGDASNLWL